VPLTEEEQAAENRALRCVEACRIDDVFADASFLGNDSLAGLARALTWAAGPAGAAGARAAQAKAFSSSVNGVVGNDVVSNDDGNNGNGNGRVTSLASPKGESDASAAVAAAVADEDGAAFCLDVLCSVTLRCRDRAALLLPHLYGYLRAIVASAKTPSALVEERGVRAFAHRTGHASHLERVSRRSR
jgi:brefeldin A-resistance guanine nucleotide exchange factor 1